MSGVLPPAARPSGELLSAALTQLHRSTDQIAPHHLFAGVEVQDIGVTVSAQPAVTEEALRRIWRHVEQARAIDLDFAGLKTSTHRDGVIYVGAKDVAGQPMRPTVGKGQCCIQRSEGRASVRYGFVSAPGAR